MLKNFKINWLSVCYSTNSYLIKHAKFFGNFSIVATTNQPSGKGAKNRKWITPVGDSLAISYLFKNQLIEISNLFPIISTISVVEALEKFKIKAEIKWINDVYCNMKKVCGVLCESSIQNKKAEVVVGIGINVRSGVNFFEKNNLPLAGSIFSQTNQMLDVKILAMEISKSLFENHSKLVQGKVSSTEFINRYCDKCFSNVSEVSVKKFCKIN